ncbi:MAG: hypothetical protein ACRDD2_02625 [Sarcina sp.]
MKKIWISTITGAFLTSILSISALAAPQISDYYDSYNFSKTGYTSQILKQKTGSNAVCNNNAIVGNSNYHTAQLVNSNNKYRSSVETVSRYTRKVLNVKVHDGTPAQAGYYYKQKHVVPSLSTSISGSFSVDDKNDW